MYISPTFELSMIGVFDPNVPNRERIILRPTQTVELTEFAMMLGWRRQDGVLIPVPDSLFWFGNLVATPPSWLVVYTGSGSYNVGTDPQRGEEVHSFFWGRKQTIFATKDIVPIVFRIGSLGVGSLVGEPATQKLSP